MKNSIFAFLLFLVFSEVRAADDVILYFREGDYIYVKSCDPKMIKGLSAKDARLNCDSQSTRVPVDAFKRMVIETNCDDVGNDSEFNKVSKAVDKVLRVLDDQSKLTTSKTNSYLKEFDFEKKLPCGLKGTVEERMKDCSFVYASERMGFNLVARSDDGKEVYKEQSSGLLWSERPRERGSRIFAELSCKPTMKEVVGLSELKWELPTSDQYLEAEKSGIRVVFQNIWGSSWTSSRKSDDPKKGLIFDGSTGKIEEVETSYHASTRCVGR